ncbi:HAD family hydrolase [Campylobacter sp. faydin G-105]|uniref:HAD family hydrolase n=1 Tax=Campylobacter anatolicus TaxID=2829105 RepID=UPI001BA1635F|nr:HAD family hydrolase [Campylobacter anatolicus]MBR8462723.1 HAD family hydrolase [Campylobacter anatolicus]
MKAVIFDMDGTIINSAKAIECTINELRNEMGLVPLDTDFIVKAINEPGRNLALDFYGIDNPSAGLKQGFEDKFKAYYDKFAVCYDGVKELLIKCRNAGYAVVLASNAPQNTLEAILRKNEIYELFDEIIGVDEGVAQKPDPAMLFLALKRTGADIAIFVGDSKKDELAAKNANIAYMQVSWGFGDGSKTAEFNAKDVDEAWSIIDNLT